jgi:hypothetical protein
MIELGMVARMARRGLALAPLVIAGCWLAFGPVGAASAAAGMAMALANLWIAGRIIGGVADNNPGLLMAAALLAFGGGLAVLTALAFALQATTLVSWPVTGFTLIGTHLVLVLWEAARAFPVARSTTTETGS